MIDTPRTDRAIATNTRELMVVDADFARELERENNQFNVSHWP